MTLSDLQICVISLVNLNYLAGGTGSLFFMGLCESFYKEDINKDDMEEVMGQILTAGCDRDSFSGWGGVVYILDANDLKIKVL